MRNSLIILKKQLKDTLKNKTVLIQFILFPVMTLIMENAIKIDGMPELFFTKLFSVMYIGMDHEYVIDDPKCALFCVGTDCDHIYDCGI